MTLAELEADVNAWASARHRACQRTVDSISDDAYTLTWLHQHRADQDDEDITTLGRRWLTRMIWHLEERVEADLRGKR